MRKAEDITESEWPIMRALWEKGSATAAEIVEAATSGRDVSMRTIKTLLRRLVAKKLVGFTIDPDDSRVYHYRPLITRDDAVRKKNSNFLSKIYQNNVAELIANFVKDVGLSREELTALRDIVAEKLEEQQDGTRE